MKHPTTKYCTPDIQDLMDEVAQLQEGLDVILLQLSHGNVSSAQVLLDSVAVTAVQISDQGGRILARGQSGLASE